jgi:hypothetical protein
MTDYRIYFLSRDGHILRPAAVISCTDDADAILQAEQVLDGSPVEVWEGARLVRLLTPRM